MKIIIPTYARRMKAMRLCVMKSWRSARTSYRNINVGGYPTIIILCVRDTGPVELRIFVCVTTATTVKIANVQGQSYINSFVDYLGCHVIV